MVFSILCVALICVITMSVSAFGQTSPIPNWVKNNAKWWSDGTITDEQYLSGIQYLVSQGTIKVSNVQTTTTPATPLQLQQLKGL